MHDLKAVSTLFDLRGDFVHGYSYGSGHINDTYCIGWIRRDSASATSSSA